MPCFCPARGRGLKTRATIEAARADAMRSMRVLLPASWPCPRAVLLGVYRVREVTENYTGFRQLEEAGEGEKAMRRDENI